MFHSDHRKTLVAESLFSSVAGFQHAVYLTVNFVNFFKNTLKLLGWLLLKKLPQRAAVTTKRPRRGSTVLKLHSTS